MAIDRKTTTCSALPETDVAETSSALHQAELRSIEATLAKALADAERINEPVVAYFIEMAIADVRNSVVTQQVAANRRNNRNMANVVRLRD